MNRMTQLSCSRSFERGFNSYFGFSWGRGDVGTLISLSMALVKGTSCGNRCKAFSASQLDHPVCVFLFALFGEGSPIPPWTLHGPQSNSDLIRSTRFPSFVMSPGLRIEEAMTSTHEWLSQRALGKELFSPSRNPVVNVDHPDNNQSYSARDEIRINQ
jgi:hypothetical protein